MSSKFVDKPAQKKPIFASNANFERSLLRGLFSIVKKADLEKLFIKEPCNRGLEETNAQIINKK